MTESTTTVTCQKCQKRFAVQSDYTCSSMPCPNCGADMKLPKPLDQKLAEAKVCVRIAAGLHVLAAALLMPAFDGGFGLLVFGGLSLSLGVAMLCLQGWAITIAKVLYAGLALLLGVGLLATPFSLPMMAQQYGSDTLFGSLGYFMLVVWFVMLGICIAEWRLLAPLAVVEKERARESMRNIGRRRASRRTAKKTDSRSSATRQTEESETPNCPACEEHIDPDTLVEGENTCPHCQATFDVSME